MLRLKRADNAQVMSIHHLVDLAHPVSRNERRRIDAVEPLGRIAERIQQGDQLFRAVTEGGRILLIRFAKDEWLESRDCLASPLKHQFLRTFDVYFDDVETI